MMRIPAIVRPSAVPWLHLGSGAFVVLWLDVGTASPVMDALPNFIKASVLGLWLILAIRRSSIFLDRFILNGWPAVVMLAVGVLFSVQIAQSRQIIYGLGYLLIAFALACFYLQTDVRRERMILMWVMVTDFAVTAVRTLFALRADPQVSRYLATTEAQRVAVYGSQSFAGLGGYGFAYSLAAILIVLLYALVRSRRKILLLVVTVVGFGVLIELAYTTAIVLVLFLGAIFFVLDTVKSNAVRIFIFVEVLLGWFSGLFAEILKLLSGVSWLSTAVSQRLLELSGFLMGSLSSGTDLGTRLSRWTISLDLFFASGPFGLAGGSAANQETGGHSAWLDLLASYGLWVLMLALFFVLAWRLQTVHMMRSGTGAISRAWALFLVLGLVNTLLFSTIVLTWLLLVPMLVIWLTEGASSEASRMEPEGMVT